MLLGIAKCGTTDFSHKVVMHPEIKRSFKKELFWWNQFRYLINASLSDFSDFYDTAVKEVVNNNSLVTNINYNNITLGEFTPHTVTDFSYWDTTNPALYNGPLKINAHYIKELFPKTQFIILLRHPTKRLYSMFNMLHRRKETPLNQIPRLFHVDVEEAIWWWQNCTAQHSRRYCLYYPVRPITTADKSFILNLFTAGGLTASMYSGYLRDWLDVFPRSQFLIIRSEEFNKNETRMCIEQIFPFLNVRGLTPFEIENLTFNSERVPGSKYPPMKEETRTLLDKLYKPFMEELAELLNDKQWLWED